VVAIALLAGLLVMVVMLMLVRARGAAGAQEGLCVNILTLIL
jgi:hypothetical protein